MHGSASYRISYCKHKNEGNVLVSRLTECTSNKSFLFRYFFFQSSIRTNAVPLAELFTIHQSLLWWCPPRARDENKDLLSRVFWMNVESTFGKYLGAPMVLGRSNNEAFAPLIEEIQRKSQGWKTRFLFATGRLTLINIELRALCQHKLSLYKQSERTVHRIKFLILIFLKLGSNSRGAKSVHWVKKEFCHQPKGVGVYCLGIPDIKKLNDALLMKQA